MNVYVDASVLLRIVLHEVGMLRDWRQISRPIASVVIRLECLRTVDRARLRHRLDDLTVAEKRASIMEQLDRFDLVPIASVVLERAADPFPHRARFPRCHPSRDRVAAPAADSRPALRHPRPRARYRRTLRRLQILGLGPARVRR